MEAKVKEAYLSPLMQVTEFSPERIICESLNTMVWPFSLPSSVSSPSEEFSVTDYGAANNI